MPTRVEALAIGATICAVGFFFLSVSSDTPEGDQASGRFASTADSAESIDRSARRDVANGGESASGRGRDAGGFDPRPGLGSRGVAASARRANGRGEAGGTPVRFALMSKEYAGIEYLPIRFEKSGMARSVETGDAVDQAIEGVPGRGNPEEPIYLDNTGHPANNRLALTSCLTRRRKYWGR